MALEEPMMVINGVTFTAAQAMTLRVALAGFQSDFADPAHCAAMGEVGRIYRERAAEAMDIMIRKSNG